MTNQQVAVQDNRSVLNAMAERYKMRPDPFEATVRAICMPPDRNGNVPNREQFTAFLLVAMHYDLNPLLKEIYAFPAKGGGIVPIVSVDGWFNLINSHPQMDGIDFSFENDEKGELVSCTCVIYRKDRTRPIKVTEYYDECRRSTEPWAMKRRMLRHKAAIQCARYAFGFGGIHDDDEGEKIAMRDITPEAPTAPDAPEAPAATREPVRVVEGEIISPSEERREEQAERQADEPKAERKKSDQKQERAKADPKPATTKPAEVKPKEEAAAPEPPTEETDPAKMGFDAYLVHLEKAMLAGTEADAAETWKHRRREFTNDQISLMIDMRGRVRQYFADLEDAADQQQGGGEPDQGEEFDATAFKDASLRLIKEATTARQVLDLKDRCDEMIAAGTLTQDQFDSWFEDEMMAAIERLPD